MRVLSSTLLALACWILCINGARGGIYVLSEGAIQGDVRTRLMLMRQMEDNDPQNQDKARPTEQRLMWLDRVAGLEKKQANGTLQPSEMIDLGGHYLYFGRIEKARKVLEAARLAAKGDKSLFFLADLNLSAAYARSGADLLPKAVQYQEEALKNWPVTSSEQGQGALVFQRRMEELVLRRLKDPRPAVSPSGELRLGEVLFPARLDRAGLVGLHFGKGPNYVVGSLQPAMWTVPPPDALDMVRELLYWSPRDSELLWLYAELLNANGFVYDAAELMTKLVDQGGINSQELQDHRQQLMHQVDIMRPVKLGMDVAMSIVADTQNQDVENNGDMPPPPVKASSWPPDWKTLGIGFLAGVLISMLGTLQIREWNRRTAAAGAVTTPSSPESSSPSVPAPPAQPTEERAQGVRVPPGGVDRGHAS